MRTCHTILALALAAAALTGCGKNPSTAAPVEQRTRFATAAKPKALPPAAAQKQPTYQAAPPATVKTRPGEAPSAAPAAPTAPMPQTGAVRLKVRTFGAATVGSLVLNVVSHADPTLAAMVPLAMNGAEADWETEDLAPGFYDLVIEVRDAGGRRLGGGKAVADVRAGEIAAVSVDITVQAAPTVTPTPGPGGDGGGAGAATSTPPPAPVTSPTPVPAAGGTLGIRVEFI
jgi:hypothetical protein